MDRAAVFLVALAASAAVVGAAAWGLRDVRALSFDAPAGGAAPAPDPPEARGIALVPLDWLGEPEEAKAVAAGPSPPEPPAAFFRPWTAPARPWVDGFARSCARTFRTGRAAFPPTDELAAGVAPETRRAAESRLPAVRPAERSEAPELGVSAPRRGVAPRPPKIVPGRLEMPAPLAEELFR